MRTETYTCILSIFFLLASGIVFADQTGLIETDVESIDPLGTINITVHDVNETCTVYVESPVGTIQSFPGTVDGDTATATYIPSYLPGDYDIYAVSQDMTTETDTFSVTLPAGSLEIHNWQCDWDSYYPGRDLDFTFDLVDESLSPLAGFSNTLNDPRTDSNSGSINILRKIVTVNPDGTVVARLQIYFDTTTGYSWSGIYSGTQIQISICNTDGTQPLDNNVSIIPGFVNNDDNKLSHTLLDGLWTVNVNSTIDHSDKIAYLDFTIPPTNSISDITFSVDYVKYYFNTGWTDRIYIGPNYVDAKVNGLTMDTGDKFSSLGRFPVYLPLLPVTSGIVYYGIHADDAIGETHLNKATFSQSSGLYSNKWQWDDYMDTQVDCFVYVDRWGYGHDYSDAIHLALDSSGQLGDLSINNFKVGNGTYFPRENLDISFELNDSLNNPVESFTGKLSDSKHDSNSGAAYILRQLIDVFEDGSSKARLKIFFDTTGSHPQYNHINAGTDFTISLYGRDGITPIDPGIVLTEGFINNENQLSSALTDNVWQVYVDNTFTGSDRVAYLEFDMPANLSMSDVVFSVDRIVYRNNSSWADEIGIAENYTPESSFPRDMNGQYVFDTGSPFSGLGRFPIKLTLNPNPNGLVFYKIDCVDIDENNLNYGNLSSTGNLYTNSFLWNEFVNTTAKVYAYVDSFSAQGHAVAGSVTLGLDQETREIMPFDYQLDSLGYTLDDSRKMSASVQDGVGNPITGLSIRDSLTNSENGKLSILSENHRTTPDGKNIVRLKMYFDTTGRWSDIYTGTSVQVSLFGPDGTSPVPGDITIEPGMINGQDYISSILDDSTGTLIWNVDVIQNFASSDRIAYLDFIADDPASIASVIYSVDKISYRCNTGWADAIRIKDQEVGMGSFPKDDFGNFEFNTGDKFGNLGRFPLKLPLTPGYGSIYPKMISVTDTELTGNIGYSNGTYTYSHHFDTAGDDFTTQICLSKWGYNSNESRCTNTIDLLFSGEPRYLGGLDTAPVRLGETWQKDLHKHFFVEADYDNALYTTSDPNIIITDNIATFSPTTSDDTVRNLVITAQSTIDPEIIISSDPFTLYAAECLASQDCYDPNKPIANCTTEYQCEYAAMSAGGSTYQRHDQGVDLSILNRNVSISNQFPQPGEELTVTADVFNTGTTYIFNVQVELYLDDVNTEPVDSNSVRVIPIAYMGMPFRSHQAQFKWTVPQGFTGKHRFWVKTYGEYPLGMEESMLSNNYATIDFCVSEPGIQEPPAQAVNYSPPAEDEMYPPAFTSPLKQYDMATVCRTINVLVPIRVLVCEDEIICGPVTGYELSYWNTIYWPSWSGYCQEFGVPQEAITDFIRTYERIMGLAKDGANSSLPSLTDMPDLLEPPDGWSDGWLPCHPEPTMFQNILYIPGVFDPGCGGFCPVNAWDCGQGVHFRPRFDHPLYNAYEFKVVGGARKITRCHYENDIIYVPYRFCYDPDSNDPLRFNFNPFTGGPGGPGGCYGGNGPGSPGSGPGNGDPIRFEITGPPTDENGNPLWFSANFESTGSVESNGVSDYIILQPDGGIVQSGVQLFKGWNTFSPLIEPLDTMSDRHIEITKGWNLFGYSSMTPLLWTDAIIDNGTEQKTIEQAHAAGWIQGVVYTMDNYSKKYSFIPGDDDFLRNKKAYWLHSRMDDLTLILPNAGGSEIDAKNYWEDMMVNDGTETLSISDAITAGWIENRAFSFDPNANTYDLIPADSNEVNAWQGYWLWSYRDDLRLLNHDYIPPKMQDSSPSMENEVVTIDVETFGTELNEPAPDFKLKNTDGQTVMLSQFSGKDVLLVFGNTLCPYCKSKIPLLNEIHSQTEQGDFKVLYVALGATEESAKEYIEKNGINFEVLIDSNQVVGRIYGIRAIPEVFIIDDRGVIQHQSTTEGSYIWSLLSGDPLP